MLPESSQIAQEVIKYLTPVLQGIKDDVETALDEIKRIDGVLRGDGENKIGLVASHLALVDRVRTNAEALKNLERIDILITESISKAIEKHQNTIQLQYNTAKLTELTRRISKAMADEAIAQFEVRMKAAKEEEERHPTNPVKALLKNPLVQAVAVYLILRLSEGFINVLWKGILTYLQSL